MDKFNKDNDTYPTSSLRSNNHYGKTVKSVKIPLLSTLGDKSSKNLVQELNNNAMVTRNVEKRKTINDLESHKNIQSADKVMTKYVTSKSTLNLSIANNNYTKTESTNLTSRSKFLNSQNTIAKEVKDTKDKVISLKTSKSLKK